jgi:transposase
MPKSRPPYPPEFRQRIIELVRKGRTPESLAEQFEPSAQTIRNWLAQADRDTGQRADGLTTDEREELRRLRRENKTLREEREILKNCRARQGPPHLLDQKLTGRLCSRAPREPWPSASWCHREPVKKHGPGVAGALAIGDAIRRSRLGK